MSYNTRKRSKGDSLTPEESQVYEATRAYEPTDPDHPDLTRFTPIRGLYQEYLVLRQGGWEFYSPQLLTLAQFGVALRTVYPQLNNPGRKVFRSHEGKRVWGYLGLNGPLSVSTSNKRGRPSGWSKSPHPR